LKQLAEDTQIPLHHLSAVINQHYGMHFNDFLNKSRIKYCENLIKNNLALKTNLKELAFKCGFNNRNSFTTAFKKFTGKTPSDYTKHRYTV